MTELNKFGVIGLLHFHKRIWRSRVAGISLSKTYLYSEKEILYQKKYRYIDTKSDVKNLCALAFSQKLSILDYMGVGEEVWGRE